jgi:hypothetical protein|tara:strand:- start:6116 stop:6319 length:204 start_codon:yes stop_codon:yes gene_type:complete
MVNVVNSLFKLVFGLFVIFLPFYLIYKVDIFYSWGIAALSLIKGSVVLLVLFIGLVFLLLGLSDMKN